MKALRWLAADLGVEPPTAREFAVQFVVATLGIVALGGIYVIGWAVFGS